MKYAHRPLAAIASVFAITLVALPSRADVVVLDGGCEYHGGVDCTASCENISFEATCDAQLTATCTGQCNVTADASCTGSCQGTCEAECTANPPMFTCAGNCTADCGADCDASCHASSQGATSEADCNGKCKASCNASCTGKCSGTPATADCKGQCQGSCSGRCTAQANASCQVSCQTQGSASCQASAKGGCSGNCTAKGGVIVCNGVAQDFVNGVAEAKAWLAAHVVVTGSSSGSSSCDSTGCHAEGQAQGAVSTKCAVAQPGTADGTGGVAGFSILGALGALFATRRRRSA